MSRDFFDSNKDAIDSEAAVARRKSFLHDMNVKWQNKQAMIQGEF